MNQILKIAKHNIRMFFIRPWTIGLLFIPIILSLCAQYLFNSDQTLLSGEVGIYAQDKSQLTSVLEEELKADQVVMRYYEDEAKLREDVEANDIDLGLVMAYDNSYKALKEGQMPYKLIFTQESQVQTVVTEKVMRLARLIESSKDEADFQKLYNQVEDLKPTIHTQGEVREIMAMTTGFSFFIMMFLLTAGIGLSPMMRERELYVYDRITVAPLRKYQYVLGHVLGAFIILFIQILIQLVSMKLLKLNFNLDSLEFIAIGITLCIVGIAISLLIFALSKESTLYYLMMGIGVTPLCMLSDTFFPIELFPVWLEKISYLSPIRWVMMGYKAMINGKPFMQIMTTLVVAMLIAIVLILMSLMLTSNRWEKE